MTADWEGVMGQWSRREFLGMAGMAAVGGVAGASPLGLPVGLQLFCLREMLAKDFAGTLRMVGALGYEEVEGVGFAGFAGKPASEVKAALKDAGLRCPSVHYRFEDLIPGQSDQARLDLAYLGNGIFRFAAELGLEYVVCSTPGFKNPQRVQGMTRVEKQAAYTREDWLYTVAQLNWLGDQANKAGLKLAYHNGVPECRAMADGVVPWELFVKGTDAGKVWFEMDCAWVKVGGQDPVAYLKKYGERVVMLHVKDYKGGAPGANGLPQPAEMGQGVFDNRAVFLAAGKGRIKHSFVEQEGFDMPVWDSLRMDAEYMRKFVV